MADINHAYGNIFQNSNNNVRKISHFFTQRKITESHEIVNPDNLKRMKKDINFTQNYLALVLPKDESSPRLKIEIYGTNGYTYQGEIISYTDNTPHLLVPLNDDKEIFVNIYDYDNTQIKQEKQSDNKDQSQVKKEKRIKYISFIHIPKRYQSTSDDGDDTASTTEMSDLKKNTTKTQSLKVNI
jgi:hypothetical protein